MTSGTQTPAPMSESILELPKLPIPEQSKSPSPPLPEKKYSRTWTKAEVEDVFNKTVKYCQKFEKSIHDLDLSDFVKISSGKRQSPEQIMVKIREVKTNGTLRPGRWSEEEDDLLISLVSRGDKNWGLIARVLNSEVHGKTAIRNSKTCKERWNNYLDPSVNRGPWSKDEILLLLQGFLKYGNKWKSITRFLPHRLEGTIKNRVKALLRKIRQRCTPEEDIMQKIREICESASKEKDRPSKKSYLDYLI
jgi:hypothetical protein